MTILHKNILALRVDDGVPFLRLRGGDGSDITQACVADIYDPPLDGKEHHVVWEFKGPADSTPMRVRLYISGELKGEGYKDTTNPYWTGSGAACFGCLKNVPIGEPTAAWSVNQGASVRNPLSYWSDKLLDNVCTVSAFGLCLLARCLGCLWVLLTWRVCCAS